MKAARDRSGATGRARRPTLDRGCSKPRAR